MSYMHDVEICAAVFILIFSEIIFVKNPLCDLWGVVDYATHYVLSCRKYLDARHVFNDV